MADRSRKRRNSCGSGCTIQSRVDGGRAPYDFFGHDFDNKLTARARFYGGGQPLAMRLFGRDR